MKIFFNILVAISSDIDLLWSNFVNEKENVLLQNLGFCLISDQRSFVCVMFFWENNSNNGQTNKYFQTFLPLSLYVLVFLAVL